MRKFLVLFCLILLLFIIGCEAENPGESVANKLPDTHISQAIPGNITTIYFYGTDDDGFVNDYAYKWDSDPDWSLTSYDSMVFVDIFSDQNEVKRFFVKGIDNRGAEDPSPAEIALSPNNILPTTKITDGPEFGKESGENVNFTFKGEDLESGGYIVSFEYTMDDLDNWRETTVDTPEATFSNLSEGAHTFYVRAVDNLGGVDSSPAQAAFIVRTGYFAPIIENKSPVSHGGGWWEGIPLKFEWTATVDHYYGILPSTPYSVAINDSTNFTLNTTAPLQSGWVSNSDTTYVPEAGIHTFYLKVRDTANNFSLMKIEFNAGVAGPELGILVVCGVPAAVFGSLIIDKINAGAYWGNLNVGFWDIFGTSTGPQLDFTLPATVSHYEGGGSGGIPPTTLAKYSTILWLGNNFQGDLDVWNNTPISLYLATGGNLILTTRLAPVFLPQNLTNYLNIEWSEGSSPGMPEDCGAYEYKPVFPGLIDFGSTSASVFSCDGFNSGDTLHDDDITNWDGVRGYSKDPFTTLLFAHRSSTIIGNFAEVRGLGVWSHPNFAFSSLSAGNEFPTPGTVEAQGNFILINGRHYGFDIQACRQNFEFILQNMCGEM